MIHEEVVEQFVVDRLKAANLMDKAGLPKLLIDRAGMYAVDESNINEFSKFAPCVLVGLHDDDATSLDVDARVRNIDYSLEVGIYMTGFWQKINISDSANKLAREIKNILSGLEFRIGDGNTDEQTSWLIYESRSADKSAKLNLLWITQRYTFRSFDHPE